MTVKLRILIVGLFLLLGMMACNLPTQVEQETPIVQGPDLTMTALFAPQAGTTEAKPEEKPATATQPPTLPPPQPPSVTLPPPTLTPTVPPPTATNTALPVPTNTIPPVVFVTQAPVVIIPAAPPPVVFLPTPTMPGATGPCTRTYEQYVAPDIGNISIDATDWTSWNVPQYNAWNVVYGSKYWIGLTDLGAKFAVAGNYQYLYIGVTVTDERYVQNATGQNIYKGDSIEILLDADLCGDYNSHTLNADDFQIGISPGNPTVNNDNYEVFKWFPRPAGAVTYASSVYSVRTDTGYRVKAAIPWSVFGITPHPGQTIGFVLSVSDNDDTQENKQESMVSSSPHRHLMDPTTWGTMILR